MRQLTGSKLSFRIAELNISSKDGGMTPRESRKWRQIADKILSAIADYDGPIQALIDEAGELQNDTDLSPAERAAMVQRINAGIKDLDESVGQDEVRIVLESDEYKVVDDIWWTLKFPADRRTRERIEAVSRMIEDAAEVTVQDGKVVPRLDVGHDGTTLTAKSNGRPKGPRALVRR